MKGFQEEEEQSAIQLQEKGVQYEWVKSRKTGDESGFTSEQG